MTDTSSAWTALLQLPAWLRLQPQTTLLFLFFEQYKGLVDKYRAKANS